jgi:hypothetical protein
MRFQRRILEFLRSGNVADREASTGSTRRPAAAGDSCASATRSSPEFISHSSEETIAQGREIAAKLRPPMIVMLSGELGSGKTTLTKGIISGLGAAREEDVTSPTFTLVHVFHNHCKVYHVDLYRVENFADHRMAGTIRLPHRLAPRRNPPRTRRRRFSPYCDLRSDSGEPVGIGGRTLKSKILQSPPCQVPWKGRLFQARTSW